VPFNGANEEMIVKVAGLAPSVAWHLDGELARNKF